MLSISVKILAGLSVMETTSFSNKFITEFHRFVGFVDIRAWPCSLTHNFKISTSANLDGMGSLH